MIPDLHAFDLEHGIISKHNRYRFKFFDRYTFLNLNFDRWKFKFQILSDRILNWPFMYLVPTHGVLTPSFDRNILIWKQHLLRLSLVQLPVLKLLLTGVQLKPMTKNNYWEFDPHVLGLDQISIIFSIEKKI